MLLLRLLFKSNKITFLLRLLYLTEVHKQCMREDSSDIMVETKLL